MNEPANREALPRQTGAGRWQFGLPSLLGTLMLLCIPFALWGAVLRANQADQFWLMILCAALPVGFMMLVGCSLLAGRFLRSRRRNRVARLPDEESW